MCTYDIENKAILELGCGVALSSLVLNKREANITATDYHPESKVFLEENVKLNRAKNIDFHLCNWSDEETSLGKFDLIIGSDVLYERDHSELLSSFINKHSKENTEVVLVLPNRGYQGKFNLEMEKLNYTHERVKPESTDNQEDFSGYIHTYTKTLTNVEKEDLNTRR